MKRGTVHVFFEDENIGMVTGRLRRFEPEKGTFSITLKINNKVVEYRFEDIEHALHMRCIKTSKGQWINVELKEHAVKEGWVPPEGHMEAREARSAAHREESAKLTHFAFSMPADMHPDNVASLMSTCGLWAEAENPHYKFTLSLGDLGLVNCERCLEDLERRKEKGIPPYTN